VQSDRAAFDAEAYLAETGIGARAQGKLDSVPQRAVLRSREPIMFCGPIDYSRVRFDRSKSDVHLSIWKVKGADCEPIGMQRGRCNQPYVVRMCVQFRCRYDRPLQTASQICWAQQIKVEFTYWRDLTKHV
jgi:hypothetical protein